MLNLKKTVPLTNPVMLPHPTRQHADSATHAFPTTGDAAAGAEQVPASGVNSTTPLSRMPPVRPKLKPRGALHYSNVVDAWWVTHSFPIPFCLPYSLLTSTSYFFSSSPYPCFANSSYSSRRCPISVDTPSFQVPPLHGV